jgi:predicted membrane channel-forming protein YqfA (hemolysin III family)
MDELESLLLYCIRLAFGFVGAMAVIAVVGFVMEIHIFRDLDREQLFLLYLIVGAMTHNIMPDS